MSLKSLERLLCTVILPSSMYGLALHESQMNEDDFQCSAGQADQGLVWGIEVLLYHCAARGDRMETSFRSCGLPPSTLGSYGLVRGGHPIDAVW